MAVSQMQGDGAPAARHFRLQMHAQAFDEETEYGMVTRLEEEQVLRG